MNTLLCILAMWAAGEIPAAIAVIAAASMIVAAVGVIEDGPPDNDED